MKHIFLFTLLVCIGLLASCTDESAIGPDGGTPTLPEGHAMVTFTFSGIGGTARSYADIAPDTDSAECRIDSVMIYVFNNDMDNNGTADETLAPADNAVLENIAKVKVEPGVSTAKNEYQTQTTFTNKGHKWFVVVANFKDTATIYAGMQYSLFKQHCTPDIRTLPTIPFIMSGADAGELRSNQPLEIDVELTRAVTRIDITIRNTEEMNTTNPFKLKQVRFANINSKGFLLWQSDGQGAFNEPANQRYTTDWIDVTGAIENNAVTGTDSVWHYLYTCETLAKTGEQVILELKGDYNGQPSEYKINLTRDKDDTAAPVIPLRNLVRNHRYLVYIDSVMYADVIGEVVVSDWDFTPQDTIPYKPGVSFGSPKPTIQDASNYTILPGIQIGDFTTDTFIVANAGYTNDDVIVIDLESYNVRSAFDSTVDWITATEEEVSTYAITSDTVAIRQRFKVTVDASNELREGMFEFYNPLSTNNMVGYAVIQAGIIGTTGVVITATGVTVNNTDKSVTMADYTSNGTVLFEFDKDAVMEIPAEAAGWLTLLPSSYATQTQTIEIARNHSYTAKSATVTFKYPGIEKNKEEYTFTQPAAPTTITVNSVTGGTLSGTNINDVSKDGATLVIQTTESFEESEYTISQSWITLVSKETVTEPTGSNKRVTRYTFTVDANSNLLRNATIQFSNSGNGSVTLTVNQLDAFSGTPLAKWAKGNLTAVNSSSWTTLTPANAGTQSAAVYGAIFQWGRNVAFTATTTSSISTTSSTVSPTSTTGNFYINSNGGVWHNVAGTASDTWTRINTSTKTTDVCPAGWHVPTRAEILQIAPASNSDWGLETDFDFATSRYMIIGNYAVMWREVAATSPYMEVKMLPTLVNGITTTNVVGHALWSNANVETRYFPTAGHRDLFGYGGTAGLLGFYWSSNASTNTDAYCLSFHLRTVSSSNDSRTLGLSVRCVSDN